MNMLKMIVRTETMLLFRNKFLAIPFLVNLLFWGYMIISYEIQATHIQERAAVFYSGLIWVLLFNLLMIGLFAVYMTSKDRESEFESLVVTYQVKNTEWIIGKWLATQLYAFCITLITLLVQVGWFASSKMTFADLVKHAIYLFVQMEGAFFIVTSLGFLCSVLIKNIFAYIIVPAILVLSLGLPFDYSGAAYTFDNPRLHLFTPFNYMFIESPYEGIWGIDRIFNQSLLHQLVVFFFGVIIILMALLLFHSHRKIQGERKKITLFIVILVIPTLFLGGVRYIQYNEAFKQFTTTAKMYVQGYEDSDGLMEYYQWENSYYDSSLDHTTYEFSMGRTDLTVEFQGRNEIDVTSHLTITYHGDEPINEVKLTLYHGLQVTRCTSESSVTCKRDKDLITVRFEEMIEPNEQFDLSLNYQGNILQYRNEGYTEQSFIDKNRVYLPKEAGWYPLIGERQLIVAREHNNHYVQFEQRNGRLVEDDPTAFTVKILNELGEVPITLTIPEIEAGLYEGISQYGLSLIGGNMDEMNVEGIRVVGHPEILKGAKEIVGKYQHGWNFIEDWLEVPMTPSVIYILNSEHAYLTWYTPSQEFLVWDYDKLKHNHGSDEELLFDLMNYLTGDLSSEFMLIEGQSYQAYQYLMGAMDWIILNQFEEIGNFKDWYLNRWSYMGEMEEDGLFILLNRYAEQGDDVFAEVVKYLFNHVHQLEDMNDFDMEAALEMYEGESNL